MHKNKVTITNQQRLVVAAARALAQQQDFNPDLEADNRPEGTLPVPQDPSRLTQLRAAADALAMRQRYHDSELHRRWPSTTTPAKKLLAIAEQVRCEALGSSHLLGLRANLASAHGNQYRDRNALHLGPQPLVHIVGLIIREKLIGIDLSEPLSIELSHHRDALWPKIGRYLSGMAQHLDDQVTFGRHLIGMIKALGLQSESFWEESDLSDLQDKAEDPGMNNQVAADAPKDGRKSHRGHHDHASQNIAPSARNDEISGQRRDQNQQHERATCEFIPTDPHDQNDIAYRVYSRKFDEEVAATSLCSAQELAHLRQRLDQQLPPIRRHLSRLSRILQAHFRTLQYHSWDFDQEDGELDPTRLSRVLIAPRSPLIFKTASRGGNPDTLVTILIDNSGSMRGKPITLAALSADMLAAALERCGIKVEILGFTTRAWRGGASRQQWLDAGCPANPGRLGDLRHIIYKSADTSWRRSRNGIGLTQKVRLLKENIDGEALLWAYRRMQCRPEPRQILMVIADGAPNDDATLSANGCFYLDHHLRRVIDFIETRTPVELVAIGIGHDITDYYQQAIRLNNIKQIGLEMTKSLCKLWGPKPKKSRRRQNLCQVNWP